MPSPDIDHCQDFADKFNRPVVVTFSIEPSGERFHITTYGKSTKLCKLAAAFGQEISKRIADGTIAAPSVEPGELPSETRWVRQGSGVVMDGSGTRSTVPMTADGVYLIGDGPFKLWYLLNGEPEEGVFRKDAECFHACYSTREAATHF